MARNRRNRRRIPEEPVLLSIESLSHEGRGVAHRNGKAVLVHGALPGEVVQARMVARYSEYESAEAIAVIEAAGDRVDPLCLHADRCGGCSLQHMEPMAQIAAKQQIMLEQLKRIGKIEPQHVFEPLTAQVWGYRRKARLGVRHVAKKGRVLVGFRERNSNYVAELNRCEVLDPRVGTRLLDLSSLVGQLTLIDRIPQIEVAVGDNAVALVFRSLDQPTAEDCELLKAFGRRYDMQIYLQPAGPDSLLPLWPECPELDYRLETHDVRLQFLPTDFTQVNTSLNQKMVDRALELLEPAPGDRILDLFCGLGNFTLPLARSVAGKVVGIEGDAQLIARARDNARLNGIANAEFQVADLTATLAHVDWLHAPYDRLLIDPPRVGALEVLRHIPRIAAPRIVYVSCNPATLARDAGLLVQEHGYRLTGAGVMDMFPHTAHVESIAVFDRG
ncbi:MAG: 23S rRNA (uracil(1939)-C(5))-methyltransferase RlmD [Proteobacteria bacterium]|nr:MAG: 23S rRNA (uracil(1939)-C(5))-methyltransferase RlmD [Pseudomonadota bacterium]QKK12269.1 MAG: 23S rRNA (uracil(1939)-C(5))-methyltransferase RlmD [Pseudomonadota bacterium]